jgi:VIT1/CCC1 family predicted Fe2+/Mn2+ transporter
MAKLTAKEREVLLKSARKIRTYKLMQSNGYKRLIKKAVDDRTKQILAEISANELSDAESWSQKIEQLADGDRKSGRVSFLSQKVGLMIGILGIRGFFEWAIIAEEMGGGGGVRDVIFGANDGLVSILALVAGVYGAITESQPILIAGVAGAVAGAISMGAGAYLSSKSEKEVTERESDRKGTKRKGSPEEEREKLVRFYQARGFERQEAEAIADRVALQLESRDSYTIGEEVGLTSEESWPPIKAATFTGLSFAVVSLIPILPFAFMEITPAVITAVIASLACLFGVGASKAIFTRMSWIRSGLEMMAIGALASVVTYAIGLAIPV